ncbi:MAG: hypothetical protein ABFD79_07585 [Phycisphaerales bacterium]
MKQNMSKKDFVKLAAFYKNALRNVLDFWINNSLDKQYGGIFYFMDIQRHPTQQLE